MSSSRIPTYLRRYTDLPALLHMLSTKQITLLDPKTWDDRNDSFFMTLYKEQKGLRSILALCFTQAPETYHHWRVFSSGSAGVCIIFDRHAILDALQRKPDVRVETVDYLTMDKAKKRRFAIDELPFLKRYGFKPEHEFRVIYESVNQEIPALDVPFQLDCIRSISLSPWMNSNLSKSTISAIRAIDGCAKLRVSRSTLISNEQWMSFGKNAI